MNEELIKQQLKAFYCWLQRSAACEMDAEVITDDCMKSAKHLAAAYAYREAYMLFSEVMEHIEKLMKEGTNK